MTELRYGAVHHFVDRGNLRVEALDVSFKLVDDAPDVAQMLKNDVVGFVGHDISLANSKFNHTCYLNFITDVACDYHCQTGIVSAMVRQRGILVRKGNKHG